MTELIKLIQSMLGDRDERRVQLVIFTAVLMLSLVYYLGSGSAICLKLYSLFPNPELLSPLAARCSWALLCFLCYACIPVLVSRFILAEPWSAQGFVTNIPKNHVKGYWAAAGLMLPIVVSASFLPSFQHTYPFVDFQLEPFAWQEFLIWEFFYLLQFIGVEYFFRGFLLFPLAKKFGKMAVYLSILPYVMIHFGKPLPETLAAAFAGWLLGNLALRSKSILPGIALHFGVAISMDVLSLWQQSR